MKHSLPELGFSSDSLSPFLSRETLETHHGKHHNAYVNKLNELIAGTDKEGLDLVELVKTTDGGLFNQAGQHYNHSFYWRCIAPGDVKEPQGKLATAINDAFGSLPAFNDAFKKGATTLFGSGWCWLVKDSSGKLQIRQTSNAGCPVKDGETPIITCDVWEHAYYIDYKNVRPDYVGNYLGAINWAFAGRCFDKPGGILDEIL